MIYEKRVEKKSNKKKINKIKSYLDVSVYLPDLSLIDWLFVLSLYLQIISFCFLSSHVQRKIILLLHKLYCIDCYLEEENTTFV